MAKIWARVVSGVVVETVTLDNTIAIADAFHADLASQFVDATAASPAVVQGSTYAGGVFSPAIISLDDVKLRKMGALRSACSEQIVGGFSSAALGSTYFYPSTALDQQNLSASVLDSTLSHPGGWTTPFWCAANPASPSSWNFVAHTASQIQQVGTDGKAFVVAAQTKLATLQAQVAAAGTADAVNAISW